MIMTTNETRKNSYTSRISSSQSDLGLQVDSINRIPVVPTGRAILVIQ